MEILLAIVVASAVIFFGALISMGNERQRKAIDGLREQVTLWAIQDLKIKREHLARDVRVNDPIFWINQVAERVYGFHPNFLVVQAFSEPRALICETNNGANKVVFSPLSPAEIRGLTKRRQNRLSQFSAENPLLFLSRNVKYYEFSSLNSGILFDLELPLVWGKLTNQDVVQMERLWMYLL